MNSLKNQKICLKEFIPEKVLCGRDCNKKYDLKVMDDGLNFILEYKVDLYNQTGLVGKRKFDLSLPRYINKNQETFEVLGLLQAEMGKQHDGKIVFCNHEYQIINKVIKWFEKELNFKKDYWKWYIKVNINEPLSREYKKEIEDKVINYWIEKSGLNLKHAYPKRVSYIRNTKNKELRVKDYGTLIIERRKNLFSQIIKIFVRKMTEGILDCKKSEVRGFMKGILAGESNVEIHLRDQRYRVFITAKEPDERLLFQNCLKKLGIGSIQNKMYHAIIISRKENNLELLNQDLMVLSNEKHSKFLRMMACYQNLGG